MQQFSADFIRDNIRAFVWGNYYAGDRKERCADDDSFLEKGIIDSTGILELVGFVEHRFGITVKDDELIPANLDSVSSLAAYVARKTALVPARAAGDGRTNAAACR